MKRQLGLGLFAFKRWAIIVIKDPISLRAVERELPLWADLSRSSQASPQTQEQGNDRAGLKLTI